MLNNNKEKIYSQMSAFYTTMLVLQGIRLQAGFKYHKCQRRYRIPGGTPGSPAVASCAGPVLRTGYRRRYDRCPEGKVSTPKANTGERRIYLLYRPKGWSASTLCLAQSWQRFKHLQGLFKWKTLQSKHGL